jgi:hypothetical protein
MLRLDVLPQSLIHATDRFPPDHDHSGWASGLEGEVGLVGAAGWDETPWGR